MNRELFSLFWLIFLFSLSLFLLWLVLPSLVSGPRRARTV
jgi:glucose-6-phosphate-specific signal transduction histidine kinase